MRSVEPLAAGASVRSRCWPLHELSSRWTSVGAGAPGTILGSPQREQPAAGAASGDRPDGTIMSTPFNALHEIYRLWHPQTDASLEQRMDVLDLLRDRHPEVAWRLLLAVVPEPNDVASGTSRPQWREWGQSDTPITRKQLLEGTHEVVRRLLDDVGSDGSRWAGLLSRIDDLPAPEYGAIAERLTEIGTTGFDAESRNTVWTALRKVLSHHLEYPDAGWALAQDQLDPLMAAYATFEPDDLQGRLAWLFSPNPDLPKLTTGGWRERQVQVENAQREAIQELVGIGGIEEVRRFIPLVDSPWILGQVTALTSLDLDEVSLLRSLLTSDDERSKEFGRAFLRTKIQGFSESLDKFLDETSEWEPFLRAEILAAMPFADNTWAILEREGAKTRDAYWALVPYLGRGELTPRDTEVIAEGLADAGRLLEALDFMAMYAANVSPGVAMEMLERVVSSPPDDVQRWSRLSYEVEQLLGLVQADPSIDEDRLASIEWFFLPFLVRGHGRGKPQILHRLMARNPDFFLTVLRLVYREDPEETTAHEATEGDEDAIQDSSSDVDKARAQMAYELLRTWQTIPGETDDGRIDAKGLKEWILTVRDGAGAARRRRIADDRIGELLAMSPVGEDGVWPHEAVRDILETASTSETDEGFVIGILNSRGITSRDPFEGGLQERVIADRYMGLAVALRDRWPRTSSLMTRVARHYERGKAGRYENGTAGLGTLRQQTSLGCATRLARPSAKGFRMVLTWPALARISPPPQQRRLLCGAQHGARRDVGR